MLDIASKIVALFVAIIGAVTPIYNIFFMGERKRKQEYYNDLLKPFAVAYKKDPNIDTVSFVRNRAKRENDSIPKYVFVLLDAQEEAEEEFISCQNSYDINVITPDSDKLKKILVDDYLNLYPNEYNRKRNLFAAVQKMLSHLMVLLTFLLIFIGVFLMAGGTIILISSLPAAISKLHSDLHSGIVYTAIGIAVVFLGLIPIKISESMSEDMYSVKKDYIEKIINKKVSRYDKRFNDYVL